MEYEELEITMRQEQDLEFADMLKRWRVGIHYPEDRIFLDGKAKLCSREYVVGAVSKFLVADGSRVLVNKNTDTRFVNGDLCVVRNIQSIENCVVSMDLT